jgi:hypothetical protein
MIRKPFRRYNLTPTRRATGSRVTVAVGASNRLARRTPIAVLSMSPTTHFLDVTFDQPVILKGIPQWTDPVQGAPLTAGMTSPTVMRLSYASSPIGGPITVPFEDPAVRNNAAGYVTKQAFSME